MAYLNKKKYIPDIAAQNAKQEQNFWRLIKLLPTIHDQDSHCIGLETSNHRAIFNITERNKYTLCMSFEIKHETLTDAFHNFTLHLRMYFDVKMAEIVACEHGKQFKGSYPYPNEQMHQVNEKEQLNDLLEQWLMSIVKFGIHSKKISIS
ncbi:DUF1249 domain-containing protein [Marinicellulosiphila megalodicopiae]|uniref:DUF1249 domain-containing protein n=1 Tax=Marinicellulosiphila megalodicopiae TaxID=2724896 RepID=UPI003BAE841E